MPPVADPRVPPQRNLPASTCSVPGNASVVAVTLFDRDWKQTVPVPTGSVCRFQPYASTCPPRFSQVPAGTSVRPFQTISREPLPSPEMNSAPLDSTTTDLFQLPVPCQKVKRPPDR